MSAVPSIDASAFKEWPQRLRRAGYEVDVREHDDAFAFGIVRSGGLEIELALLTHVSGSATPFVTGRNSGRRDKDFVWAIVAALRAENVD